MPVIFGTDFSPAATAVAPAAAALARKLALPLEVVHIWPGGAADARARLVEKLEAERSRLAQPGLDVTTTLAEGHPDEALVERAQASSAHFIVTGALGARQGGKWKLGSIPDRLAQSTPRPFLVLRDPAAFLAWQNGERALRLVVGDDRSPISKPALDFARELGRAGPVEVTVVHAYFPPAEWSRLGVHAAPDAGSGVERVLARELTERLSQLGLPQAKLKVVMCYGRVADPLVAVATEVQADLIVVGAHHRSSTAIGRLTHGSVSRWAMETAPMSVALVPGREAARGGQARIPAIRSVIVSTDFSDVANAAIPHAYALLPKGGTVTMVHVVSVPAAALYGVSAEQLPGTGQVAELRRALEALVPEDAPAAGVETKFEVVPATDVTHGICQVAERTGADVICMSSHGRSGLSRLVAGSVAEAVIARARRPVFLIHPRLDEA